jgi:hypothetical protein
MVSTSSIWKRRPSCYQMAATNFTPPIKGLQSELLEMGQRTFDPIIPPGLCLLLPHVASRAKPLSWLASSLAVRTGESSYSLFPSTMA